VWSFQQIDREPSQIDRLGGIAELHFAKKNAQLQQFFAAHYSSLLLKSPRSLFSVRYRIGRRIGEAVT
jgi:hypothetical protein